MKYLPHDIKKISWKKMLSETSHKAALSTTFGYLQGIHYMAPAGVAGVGNLCPWASEPCKSLCLGEHSGMAAIYSNVIASRINKARCYMLQRKAYMAMLYKALHGLIANAKKQNMHPVARLNGSTDINWIDKVKQFPELQFVEYTKSVKAALAHARGDMPENLHITFSFSGNNWSECLQVLRAGGNVAVCFGTKGKNAKHNKRNHVMPDQYMGFDVINGDLSDLRFLDPDKRGKGDGVIVALTPKGGKAAADNSGFVVWL